MTGTVPSTSTSPGAQNLTPPDPNEPKYGGFTRFEIELEVLPSPSPLSPFPSYIKLTCI